MLNGSQKTNFRETERRALPFFVEFVKFATGFALIIVIALVALHVAAAAM